jgi:hypothetical protein
MTDYTKLVKALRCKRDDCEGCDLAFFDKDEGWMCQYAAKDDDAADAIEALQAEMPKRGEIVRCGECKHYNAGFECLAEGYGIERDPDWFCAGGERKVQE